jgi:hypothetical protein
MKKNMTSNIYNIISRIIEDGRDQVRRNVISTLVITCRQIGKIIAEDEFKGNYRGDYGGKNLPSLSGQLTKNFGKGSDSRNLHFMKQFNQYFPYMNLLRSELSWSHYRHLLRVEREAFSLRSQNVTLNNWWGEEVAR